jgi:hypothetical protein
MSDYIPTTEEKGKNPVGKPLLYPNNEMLQSDINNYFEQCDISRKPYTICGLANYLGMTRQTLLNYENKDQYFDTIKKAKSRCEQYAEECLFNNRQVAGVIFNLKNNYKWKDEQKQELSGNVTIGLPPSFNDAKFPT